MEVGLMSISCKSSGVTAWKQQHGSPVNIQSVNGNIILILSASFWRPPTIFTSWFKILINFFYFRVPFSSVAQSCLTLWDPMNLSTPGLLSITNSRSLPKLMSIESVMPSSHLILCRPLLLLPAILPSIRVFSNESALHIRWPKYWSFNISPSNEHPGLISFRMDWLDLLAVQEILKSLLQHHNSKASILWHSAFFTV